MTINQEFQRCSSIRTNEFVNNYLHRNTMISDQDQFSLSNIQQLQNISGVHPQSQVHMPRHNNLHFRPSADPMMIASELSGHDIISNVTPHNVAEEIDDEISNDSEDNFTL